MKSMKEILSLFAVLFLWTVGANAQSNTSQGASHTGTIDFIRVEPSLASKDYLEPAVPLTEAPKDGRSSKNLVVPGKDKQTEDDQLMKNAHPMTNTIPGKMPELVFDVNNSVGPPSDPSLAVGNDHVFIVYNTGFIIYDKDGNDLTGPLNVNNIFSNNGCCDLTVSYDSAADRWVVTYLFFGSGAEVAISDGSDPITSDWTVYSVSQINDYQKLSVWSDGYYMTDNTGSSNKIWALERDAMLDGDPNAGIQGFDLPGIATSGFYSPQALNVTDDNMPADGALPIIFLQDDAWGGISTDHVKMWLVDVDWDTPGNSAISTAIEFDTEPFISVFDGGSFSNLSQPGGGSDIDALQSTIMNQAQFKKFDTYNSALFNFVIDTDAGAGELAAVRWYEFRQDGDGMPWSIYQEGTFSSPDGKHAWMASLAMDYQGNIGMGYTAMAGPDTPNPTDHRVSIYYTGRYAADPLGTMTIEEELIGAGNGNVGGIRYGDYGKLDIDPENNKEFWFISEYIHNGGKDIVGVFQIAPNFNNDIGVVSIDTPTTGALTDSEEITVTVFNFGLDDATGFDVSFQIDGGAVITEPFVGTIPSASTAQFTFVTTGDFSTEGQTYTITSSTVYGMDEFNENDATSSSVTQLYVNDSGVSAITNPVSGTELNAADDVTVTIKNFGSATLTSIPVFYSVDGGAAIQETYTGSIAMGETDDYTFTTTIDLSSFGEYDITVGTELDNDGVEDNDDFSISIEKFNCQPETDCANFNDGVTQIELADQDILCDCSESGYTDNTDIVFNFMLEDNPFEGVMQAGYENTTYALWIDFDDNYQLEDSELVATGNIAAADVNENFSIDFSALEGVTPGMHLMRLRGIWATDLSELENEPCDDAGYGRTNDYTANISGSINVNELGFNNDDLTIRSLHGNQFELILNSATNSDKLPVTIFTGLGQTLAFYTLENNGGGYSKVLDMSYMSAGIYFVKVGNDDLNIVRKIVVE